MTIVNTETIPGKTVVAVKGLVQGNTVRAKNIGRDIAAITSGASEMMAYGTAVVAE